MDNRKPRPIQITDRLTARFWRWVTKPDGDEGCWEWAGTRSGGGYGTVGNIFAHRYSYTLLVGPIPEGLHIDHLCRVRHCVNPAHLEPVTHRENILRGIGPTAQKARQTTCVRGHELDGRTEKGRYCKTCSTDRSLSAYQRRRAMGMSVTEARYGSPVKPRKRAS